MLQADVRQLIATRYAAVHGATPPIDYPHYCVVAGRDGPRAALGYRRAGERPLFLEAYLDAPVELVLSGCFARPIAREEIVEIGDHASQQSRATLTLWAEAANRLSGEAEYAVAVLTAPLRTMFRRIGLAIHEIAPAGRDRLGIEAADWGQYYAADPIVCAGEIAAGKACLTRWAGEGSEL